MPDPEPRRPWTQRIFSRVSIPMLVGSLLAGAALAAAGWALWLRPMLELQRRRYATISDVLYLYGLEMNYGRARKTYANDLDTLLATAPDGAARKAAMAGHLDLSTLTIVGDARKFKIEANALDADRTLIKIKGPIIDHPYSPLNGPTLQEGGSSVGGEGAPVLAPAPRPR